MWIMPCWQSHLCCLQGIILRWKYQYVPTPKANEPSVHELVLPIVLSDNYPQWSLERMLKVFSLPFYLIHHGKQINWNTWGYVPSGDFRWLFSIDTVEYFLAGVLYQLHSYDQFNLEQMVFHFRKEQLQSCLRFNQFSFLQLLWISGLTLGDRYLNGEYWETQWLCNSHGLPEPIFVNLEVYKAYPFPQACGEGFSGTILICCLDKRVTEWTTVSDSMCQMVHFAERVQDGKVSE